MATPVELIKEKLDIASVIKGYIELTPAGRNFKARCPFHGEKTPSFIVTPDRGSWHCFGCSLGGDVFNFVMRYEHIEFPDALRLLAEKAGVELRQLSPQEERFTGVLYRINLAAAAFFASQVGDPLPATYLKERGISQESIDYFEIGWASQDQDALTKHLKAEGHDTSDLVRAGLTISTDYGLRDRFRGRIMFPIWSSLGKVIGFTGRIHPQCDTGNLGKYVNSPETPIFTKGKVLYGYGKTKEAIRQAGRVVLVEGQVDAVACWQSGVRNVVALSGTALTGDHVQLLSRSTGIVDLAFDGDDAGWQAAERSAHLIMSAGLETNVITWPGSKDAGDLLKENPQLIGEAVRKARPLIEVWIERLITSTQTFRDQESMEVLRRILQLIDRIISPVAHGQWIQHLSRKTGIPEGSLESEVRGMRAKQGKHTPPEVQQEQAFERLEQTRWDALAEQTLAAAYHSRELSNLKKEHLPETYQVILELLRTEQTSSADNKVDAFLRRIITAPSVVLGTSNLARLQQELEDCFITAERARLSGVIADAERFGDEDLLEETLRALAALPRR